MIQIPNILIQRLATVGTQRFIRVAKGDKNPIDTGWQQRRNLRLADDPELETWLAQGGNYGVVGGHGLIIIDADNQTIETLCQHHLPRTFSVQSPGSKMLHRYYRSDLNNAIRIHNTDGDNVGDIQGLGKQVLGPNSIHPNGNPYRIADDAPITYLSEKTIREVFKDWIIQEKTINDIQRNAHTENTGTPINILNVLKTYNIHLQRQGTELYGSHPIHGSKGRKNFWVDPTNNQWHCFRCRTGGGSISLIAILENIIECKDAVKGGLHGENFINAMKKAREKKLVKHLTIPELEHGDGNANPTDFFTLKDDGTIKTFIPERLAKRIMSHYQFFAFDTKSDIYYYDKTRGVWNERGNQVIRELSYHYLKHFSKRFYVDETLAYIRDTNYIQRAQIDHDKTRIPVKNGVLNLITTEIEPFNPKLYALTAIPVTHNPDATCPHIIKFLNDVAPYDIHTLQEWIGYHLLRNYKIQKCVQLIGEGSNGKSTFLRLLQEFLGIDNVSNASLYELIANRFAKAHLYGKLGNIAADISPDELKRTGVFKALTGGDYLQAEKKHQNGFKFLNYAKLSFSANRLPPTPDHADAFFRRWLLITFPNTFEGDNCDENIIEKITTHDELSGLLNWALEGLQRLHDNGKFTTSLTCTETREQWEMMSNPVEYFVKTQIEFENNNKIHQETVYQAFLAFALEKKLDVSKLGTKKFSNALQVRGAQAGKSTQIDGVKRVIYTNVRLTTPPSKKLDAKWTNRTITSISNFFKSDLESHIRNKKNKTSNNRPLRPLPSNKLEGGDEMLKTYEKKTRKIPAKVDDIFANVTANDCQHFTFGKGCKRYPGQMVLPTAICPQDCKIFKERLSSGKNT